MQLATNTGSAKLARLVTCAFILLLVSGMLVGCGGADPAEDLLVTPAERGATSSEEATDTAGEVGAELTNDEDADPTKPNSARWSEITDLVSRGALLLCVDTKAEFDAEHVTGATSVPAGKIDDTSGGWKKDATIVLTSSAEEVARSVASHLARDGFTDVYYLAGGYDEWDGTFEGSSARKATVPSRIYYLYTTDPNAPVLTGDMDVKQYNEIAEGISVSMQALETQFPGDIEVETIDAFRNNGRAWDLVRMYNVDTVWLEGAEYARVPLWILVDRDGYVSRIQRIPWGSATAAVYGWCVEQAEAE